jgi:hypothetical protein
LEDVLPLRNLANFRVFGAGTQVAMHGLLRKGT